MIKTLIALIAMSVFAHSCTRSDDPIQQASRLDGEYAIAICGQPTRRVPHGIPVNVWSNQWSSFRLLRLRDTGIEYCAIVDGFVPDNVERVRVEFPASRHGIEQLHVYHMPPRTTLASHPGPQRAVFTSVPISHYDTFEFKVIPTQTDEPAVFIGEVIAGDPLLVPIDGLY